MCSETCIDFVRTSLKKADIKEKSIIEVGAMDVNGSVRSIVELLNPSGYVGTDVRTGPGVDRICRAENLANRFGHNSFDALICTEVLEHVRDWRKVINNFKRIIKPGGILLITARSRGFPYHGYPFDFWRYEISDIRRVFSDFDICVLKEDSRNPGVFLLARKPPAFNENRLDKYSLYSIFLNRKASIRVASIYWAARTTKALVDYCIKHPLRIYVLPWHACRRLLTVMRSHLT